MLAAASLAHNDNSSILDTEAHDHDQNEEISYNLSNAYDRSPTMSYEGQAAHAG
jgi:hypothetical protein